MSEHFFADGVAELSVVGGVVRIQFGLLKREDDKSKGQASLRPSVGVNIPLEGFAHSMAALQQLFDKLVKDGVLKPKEPAAIAAPSSPNFQ